MKKLTLILAVFVLVAFAGCKKDEPAPPADKPVEAPVEKPAEAPAEKPAEAPAAPAAPAEK